MSEEFFKPYYIDEITLKKMKSRMLEMLLYFKEFCNKHGLMFYLCGGAAIGAAREHGFIPWDDDIDCFMPRKDYEKFPLLWEKYGDKDKYVFCRSNEKINFHHSCSSLRDPRTTFICTYNKNIEMCHGLALEFGPIDGCPNSNIKRIIQLFWAFIFALFNTQRLPNNKGKFFRILTKIVYKLIPSFKIKNRIWKLAEREMSKYDWKDCDNVKELIGSIKGMSLIHPKEWFSSQIWLDFENHKVPLMAGYHQYLSRVFGDYMTPPPKSQRVAKHELIFVDMDHPYTDYKNVYYFPEG